ncbi:MAG: AhpC/TSA family protein [Planctomycetota bacterium]
MSSVSTSPSRSFPRWMSVVLFAAAGYNLVWGAWVVLFPNQFFDWVGMARPVHPSIWQCVGMIVGVYGIGYAIAATNPLRHWPIVLVGFLGKVLGPLGYMDGALIRGELSPAFGWTIPTNDLIWWVPFAMILLAAFRAGQGDDLPLPELSDDELEEVLAKTQTEPGGVSVAELSRQGPVLLMLVRHFGCTFCRQAMAELSGQQTQLRQQGVTPVIVHQSDVERGREYLNGYGLDEVLQISDSDKSLYRSLGLPRGSFAQLFGIKSTLAGFRAVKHGVGKLEGDGFQMPGAFLVRDGRVIKAYRYAHAGDAVDACEFAYGLEEHVSDSESSPATPVTA